LKERAEGAFWLQLGSRFAAGNKGGCVVLVLEHAVASFLAGKIRRQNLAFVKRLETAKMPPETGY
jgi:hypothetical protein